MIGALIGLCAFALVLVGFVFAMPFALGRQAELYEAQIEALERDRDLARNEAKVFRNLLFPVLTRAEAGSGDAEPEVPATVKPASRARTPRSSASPETSSNPAFDRRIPFRLRFNRFRKASNTPQIKHDALVSALEQQKVPAQEKNENGKA